MADTTLVVVNFRSAALTAAAIVSARAASDSPLHVVVVDNSVDRSEAEDLARSGADEVIVSAENVGYGAAINAALPRCRETVVISNPDVIFAPGAIDLLAAHLSPTDVVTGPRFTWDSGGEWLLPPAEMLTAGAKISEALAVRSAGWRAARGRRRFLSRLRFWECSSPSRPRALSGAVLCMRKATLMRAGGFDERFRLYFEEIDLMRTIGRSGGRLLHVPAAVCRHLYNQSAARSPEAGRLYAESEARYLEKWYGARFLAIIPQLAGRRRAEQPQLADMPAGQLELPLDPSQIVVEASPLPTFDSAAGYIPRSGLFHFPEEIAATCAGRDLFVRIVRRGDGREVVAYRLVGRRLSVAKPVEIGANV